MRKIPLVIAALCFSAQAFAAGSIPVALAQQSNANGIPLVNCNLYLYVTGTVASPQYAYQDTSLTQLLPWPLTCDTTGRLPMFYLADGSVHVRLTDSSGVVQFDYPSMLVIGPSAGGGGGSTVDPTSIASTGDIKFRPTSEFVSGWVKLNGQTIGSATSGASQRANADTQNLFIYLWTNCTDGHCPVIGGRGATALADFNANKKLTLPDWRGRTTAGLDDMGSTALGLLQPQNMTGGNTTITPGGAGGEAVHLLALSEAPVGQFTFNWSDPGHTHSLSQTSLGTPPGGNAQSGGGFNGMVTTTVSIGNSVTNISAYITDHAGGGSHNVMSPFVLGTWYEKL